VTGAEDGLVAEPPTPYLRVDVARLLRNVRDTAAGAAAQGVALRPHVKTHKTLEIARLQAEAGLTGITVATIGEAEVFVEAGYSDVFVGYPLWPDDRAARRVAALAERASITLGVDSVEAARQFGRLLGGRVRVLVELDSGQHRTGTVPTQVVEVTRAALDAGLEVAGVFTFPGHGYAVDGPVTAAADEARTLGEAVDALRAAGLEPAVVSGGSTPTLAHSRTDLLTELRPGVYVFGDAQQWELGAMPPERISLTCRATVVSHSGGRAVLDAGSKVLGADRAAFSTGFGRLLDHPDARVLMIAEHRAVVDLAGAPLPALGSVVDVVPNHVCVAVNLVDELWADTGAGLERWPVVARGRNA
jgi:D-serine deaminase-like pyridoxal phosphate-dependent protein